MKDVAGERVARGCLHELHAAAGGERQICIGLKANPMSQKYQDELLTKLLTSSFGALAPATLDLLRERTEWLELDAGEVLMRQGEAGDSMYLVVSGRLRAYVRDSEGVERAVGELARGQTIGELSMFTHDERSATVVAIRNAVLVRLDRAEFNALMALSPEVAVGLTRQIIERLRGAQQAAMPSRPVTMCLLPITRDTNALAFAHTLAVQLEALGVVRVLDAATLDTALRERAITRRGLEDADATRRIARYLDETEAICDYVLLVADEEPTPWTHRCVGFCDEVLLLAQAKVSPTLHANEKACLMQRAGRAEAREVLVLLHDASVHCPQGTRRWLQRRAVAGHIHIRPALARDMARLARIQSRTAIGLVLSGGGARGLAHLGVLRALEERGVEVDWVGGTSIGSVMATFAAADQPVEQLMVVARRAFSTNPTGDFNWAPLLSLIVGRRLKKIVERAVVQLLGHTADVEDLWKNFYCVASNVSQAQEQVVQSGNLAKAIRASIAIPGALPPVLLDGDLLCDGATFNNFPVDVMRNTPGVGRVIGVDLNRRSPQRYAMEDVPSNWALLRDRLRPKRLRRYQFPSLIGYLINVTVLYSISRQRISKAVTDLYFNPPLENVGMLQWHKFDAIVDRGYQHAQEVLLAAHDWGRRPGGLGG